MLERDGVWRRERVIQTPAMGGIDDICTRGFSARSCSITFNARLQPTFRPFPVDRPQLASCIHIRELLLGPRRRTGSDALLMEHPLRDLVRPRREEDGAGIGIVEVETVAQVSHAGALPLRERCGNMSRIWPSLGRACLRASATCSLACLSPHGKDPDAS
jgi:hypothetical protein